MSDPKPFPAAEFERRVAELQTFMAPLLVIMKKRARRAIDEGTEMDGPDGVTVTTAAVERLAQYVVSRLTSNFIGAGIPPEAKTYGEALAEKMLADAGIITELPPTKGPPS